MDLTPLTPSSQNAVFEQRHRSVTLDGQLEEQLRCRLIAQPNRRRDAQRKLGRRASPCWRSSTRAVWPTSCAE
jgi:hypothetical protein